MTAPAPEVAPPPPEWLPRVAEAFAGDPGDYFRRFPPPASVRKHSAVLMLFGPRPGGGENVVLTERTAHLRSHPGQVSFPGGSVDPGDTGPVDTALREAGEEVGLDRSTVEILGVAPGLHLGPSNTAVTPVLAWWPRPHPLAVSDPEEVARVDVVAVEDLLDPANRFTVVHPAGYAAPGFEVGGLFVWGFTAMLLTTVLDLGGLTRPWDEARQREMVPDRLGNWVPRR